MKPMKEQFDEIGASKIQQTKILRGTDLLKACTTFPVYLSVVDSLDEGVFLSYRIDKQ